MKNKLILSFGLFCGILLHAQTIEETTFTEKNKTMQAFGFTNPVCNQDVMINTWKNFIKMHNGQVKGGMINKATGSNIQFSSDGELWNGYFAYSYNEDNTMEVFTSFQNMQGDFLTSKTSPSEVQSVKEALEEFKLNIQKDCNQDDLNRAKNYSNSLSKEKIRNSDRIMFLEKSIQTDQQKVDLNEGKTLSDKDQLYQGKFKQRIVSSQTEIQVLKDRNNAIDEEIKSQSLVIQRFQQKKDELEGKIPTINEEESVDTENKTVNLEENTENKETIQEDTSGKYFDR